jgi:type IV pilus assembly protein PilY1
MHVLKHLIANSLMAFLASVSHAQLAQEPLLNRPNTVAPNVVLILDNSASMGLGYIYEYGLDPGVGPQGPGSVSSTVGQPTLLYPYRSPDMNKITYDPRIRYLGRRDANGVRQQIPPSGGASWSVYFRKRSGPYAVGDVEKTLAGYHSPSYFPAASEVVSGSAAAYPNTVNTAVLPASTLFPKFVERTDCTTYTNACTLVEEIANYTVWSAWYSTRGDVAINGISEAFFGVADDSIRLGYANYEDLQRFSANAPHLARGVSSFSGSPSGTKSKQQFQNWLATGLTFNQTTPTLNAVNNVGKYFERIDSDGPWGTNPNPASVTLTSPVTVLSPESPLSHASCRRSYAMLVTDGYWNDPINANNPVPSLPNGGNPDGVSFSILRDAGPPYQYFPKGPYQDLYSNTLADIAMHYWGRDLRPDIANKVPPITLGKTNNPSFWQNMSFYALTMGMKGTLPRNAATLSGLSNGSIPWPKPVADKTSTIDDTWHATLNGHGEVINANNSKEINEALSNMLTSIVGTPQTLSGVAVSSSFLKNGTRKYKPEYVPGLWSGNLRAIELDATTGNEKIPAITHWQVESGVDVADDPISTIPAAAARNIATWNGSVGVVFNAANTSLSADLLDYLRGDSSKEARRTGGSYRNRTAKLGDIVNSNPVFVKDNVDLGYEALGLGDYRAFVASKAARAHGVLFVGANDGMLHAFRDLDGLEVFAYVPRSVIPDLYRLSETSFTHRYFVDGPSVETDAYLNGTWRNVLVSTTGAGAKSIFALDVTSPLAMGPSSVLWEISNSSSGFSQLGHVLSEVQTGVLPDGRWVAIFGNGIGSVGGVASLFVVNLQTGALISEVSTGVGGGNGLGGVRLVYGTNKRIVGAYAGDLKGNVWKFDLSGLSGSEAVLDLGGQPLYSAGATQPITAAPAVLPHPNRGYVVAFGTGKFVEASDVNAPFNSQRLYGVWDAQPFGATAIPSGAALSGVTQLVQQVITTVTVGSPAVNYFKVSANPVNWGSGTTGVRGWYIELPNAGQRSVYPMERLVGTFVMASTLSPISATPPDACYSTGSGSGWVYIFDGVTGSGPVKPTLDTNFDGIINALDAVVSGYVDPVDGRPASVTLPGSSTVDRLCIETAQASCTKLDLQCGQAGAKSCPGATSSDIKSRKWRQVFMR